MCRKLVPQRKEAKIKAVEEPNKEISQNVTPILRKGKKKIDEK